MASLPSTPFSIHGGCFCKAITYTISVPALESRPLIPDPPKRPFGPQRETTKRLPLIALDHCNSCRQISGAIIECWFICPQAWTQFYLLPRDSHHPASGVLEIEIKEKIEPTTLQVLIPSPDLEEKTYLKGFESSDGANRTFCGRCGTHFTFHWTADGDDEDKETQKIWGPYFDMAMGTFDRESLEMEGMTPSRQSWWADGIKWIQEMVGE